MGRADQEYGVAGLHFFGKISASVSHDIKNAFSIINENAGLLTDLVQMAEQGMPLDPERVKRVAGGIQAQIRQADTIVRNMNTFAHSVDHWICQLNVAENLSLITGITNRLVAARGVTVEVLAPAAPLTVTGPRYQLLHLFWHCIDAAVAHASEARRITVDMVEEDAYIGIRFTGVENVARAREAVTGEPGGLLLAAAGAEVSADDGGNRVTLSVPVTCKQRAEG